MNNLELKEVKKSLMNKKIFVNVLEAGKEEEDFQYKKIEKFYRISPTKNIFCYLFKGIKLRGLNTTVNYFLCPESDIEIIDCIKSLNEMETTISSVIIN